MDRSRVRTGTHPSRWVPLTWIALALPLLGVTATGTVTVTGAIGANCTITGSTLAFGAYNVLSSTVTQVTGTNALSVACTRGATAVTIALGSGNNAAHASGTTRALSNGSGNYLSYELYTSNTYATVWNASNTVSYSPTSLAATSFTVYGEIPAQQNVLFGNYTDSVQATVSF